MPQPLGRLIMDDMLTRLGLGDLVPRIRNYWYDEIEDLDLNSERIMFTDVEGETVIISFKQCRKTWFESGF